MKIVLILFLLLPLSFKANAAAPYKIVTGSERGTYIQIGKDLAKWVAGPADVNLEVLPSAGSGENVQRLRTEPGVRFALVQSDVYQAFLDQAEAGNKEARRLIEPLRVIMPLYDEEIYFITRADSPLKYIHEIKDKKINIGPIGSGTALSSTTLYKLMFGQPIPEDKASYLSNEDALIKLTTDKTLDVVIVVAGQPAKLFVEMKPEARQVIKFLRLDKNAPATTRAARTYFPTTIRTSSYSSWLTEDIPTLTVKAYLVTYNYESQRAKKQLAQFAQSLCENFSNLQTEGHPKWKEVNMDLPFLGKNWTYSAPMEREFRACKHHKSSSLAKPIATSSETSCTQQQRILGLCKSQ
jgi:uncharacterized protein